MLHNSIGTHQLIFPPLSLSLLILSITPPSLSLYMIAADREPESVLLLIKHVHFQYHDSGNLTIELLDTDNEGHESDKDQAPRKVQS